MDTQDSVLCLCPFPHTTAGERSLPMDGCEVEIPSLCKKKFGDDCREHYALVAQSSGKNPIQCPFGFSSWKVPLQGGDGVVTGLVPFPRLGGEDESRRAQDYKQNRVATEKVSAWIDRATSLEKAIAKRSNSEFTAKLHALHEVRRLNGVTVTICERLCDKNSPGDPDAALPDMVRAWKAASLISVHLDSLDLLANPESAENSKKEDLVLYKVVDKVFKIYRPTANSKGITLKLTGHSTGKARLDKNTIHILPSVLIDNAIKYSQPHSHVEISVAEFDGPPRKISVEVRNTGPVASKGEQLSFFKEAGRGVAARKMADGTGFGLYLAGIVARINGAQVECEQEVVSPRVSKWIFRFQVVCW